VVLVRRWSLLLVRVVVLSEHQRRALSGLIPKRRSEMRLGALVCTHREGTVSTTAGIVVISHLRAPMLLLPAPAREDRNQRNRMHQQQLEAAVPFRRMQRRLSVFADNGVMRASTMQAGPRFLVFCGQFVPSVQILIRYPSHVGSLPLTALSKLSSLAV
jgi:hypothetical protein